VVAEAAAALEAPERQQVQVVAAVAASAGASAQVSAAAWVRTWPR